MRSASDDSIEIDNTIEVADNVAHNVTVGLGVCDDTIEIADNVAYDVAVGLGASDDTIEIDDTTVLCRPGPRCKLRVRSKKSQGMIMMIIITTIVAVVSSIETLI